MQSHSQAVASPTTSVDRLEEVEVSGLPSGPQEPWSTDEGGFLRLAAVRTEEVITIIKIQGGAKLTVFLPIAHCVLSTTPTRFRTSPMGAWFPSSRPHRQ